VPAFDSGWQPVLDTMRAGNYFVTSGEVLFRDWGIEGAGPRRFFNADVEWTFAPEFAELVWGDGKSTDRELISMKDLAPLASRKLHIPFDIAGKKWVRFAVWDSAGNGAFTQPVHLN
jgi:hypothetical protein